MTDSGPSGEEDFEDVIQHVFLPPKLPTNSRSDADARLWASIIFKLIDCLPTFIEHFKEGPDYNWAVSTLKILEHLKSSTNPFTNGPSNTGNNDESDQAKNELAGVLHKYANQQSASGQASSLPDQLPIIVPRQNAGILVTPEKEGIRFDTFELTPPNVLVVRDSDRLIRRFPASSVLVPYEISRTWDFCDTFADFIKNKCSKYLMSPNNGYMKSFSQPKSLTETPDPSTVTKILVASLLILGRPQHDRPSITKHTREEVFAREHRLPWHRSAVWLFLRVILHLHSVHVTEFHDSYKKFMIFFMCFLLTSNDAKTLSRDHLFCMQHKIASRALKLNIGNEEPEWLRQCQHDIKISREALCQKWSATERADARFGAVQKLNALHPTTATLTKTCTIPALEEYVGQLATLETKERPIETQHLPCVMRGTSDAENIPILSGQDLQGATTTEHLVYLMDFEIWVECKLESWLSERITRPKTAVVLLQAMRSYHKYAVQIHENCPEDTSLMILTLLCLWKALDQCTCAVFDLFAQYDPVVPTNIPEPLLLAEKSDMDRASNIDSYIRTRRQAAIYKGSSAVSDCDSANSFPVRFFQASDDLKGLKAAIESDAKEAATKKIMEFNEKKDEYERILDDWSQLECERYERTLRNGTKILCHKPRCYKCQLERQLNAIEIKPQEWPLPSNEEKAMAVVFALKSPDAFCAWRDATYFLLETVLQPAQPTPEKVTTLKQIQHEEWFASHCSADMHERFDIQLAKFGSKMKSTVFKGEMIVGIGENDLSVPHRHKYALHNSSLGIRIEDVPLQIPQVRDMCTFKLKQPEYEPLQKMLRDTTHTTNEVQCLLEQNKSIDMRQFAAFGSFRSGHRLQWIKLLIQLAVHHLDFRQGETELLILQGLWQLGPEGNLGQRECHIEPTISAYISTLLTVIDKNVTRFKGNWQATTAFRVLVTVVLRCLSLVPESSHRRKMYGYLSCIRGKMQLWLKELLERHKTCNRNELQEIRARVFELALDTCWTFSADMDRLEFNSVDEARIYFDASLLLYHFQPCDQSKMSEVAVRMWRRCQRFRCRHGESIRDSALRDSTGLSSAIAAFANSRVFGLHWEKEPSAGDQWLVGEIHLAGQTPDPQYHYNFLTGELRCQRRSFARLPESWIHTPRFQRVLSHLALEFVPSDNCFFQFQTRDKIEGQTLFITSDDESNIRIAISDDKTFWHYVPVEHLSKYLPANLINGMAHFYDSTSSTIQLRRIKDLFNIDEKEWRLSREGSGFKITKGTQILLDRSQNAFHKAIVGLLQPIETESNVHVIFDTCDEMVRAMLPRLGLSFHLNFQDSCLVSDDFRDMTIDQNQSCGVFSGLINKLVLRHLSTDDRTVIIPYGSVTVEPFKHHQKVSIDTTDAQEVSWHCFGLDPVLGQVTDNGSLQTRLFRCLLHAYTSAPLPDTLTGKTGTEEAISVLQSPCTASFLKIEPDHVAMLLKLAELSPKRSSRAANRDELQVIEWGDLSPIAQHPWFRTIVKEFLNRAKEFQKFQKWTTDLQEPDISRECELLTKRAISRNFYLRTDSFRCEILKQRKDRRYTERNTSVIEKTVGSLYQVLFHGMTTTPSITSRIKLFDELTKDIKSKIVVPKQVAQGTPEIDDLFAQQWFEDPNSMTCRHWYSLFNWAVGAREASQRARFVFSLSLLVAFGLPEHLASLLCLTFREAKLSPFVSLSEENEYSLSMGCKPSETILRRLVSEHAKSFPSSPEASLNRRPDETERQLEDRRKSQYEKSRSKFLSFLVKVIQELWPTRGALSSNNANAERYFNLRELKIGVQKLFEELDKNQRLFDHISLLQGFIDSCSVLNEPKTLPVWPDTLQTPATSETDTRRLSHTADILELLSKSEPPSIPNFLDLKARPTQQQLLPHLDITSVKSCFDILRRNSPDELTLQMRDDYNVSLSFLRQQMSQTNDRPNSLSSQGWSYEEVSRQLRDLETTYEALLCALKDKRSITEQMAIDVGAWPFIGPTVILNLVSSKQIPSLPAAWAALLQKWIRGIATYKEMKREMRGRGQDTIVKQEKGEEEGASLFIKQAASSASQGNKGDVLSIRDTSPLLNLSSISTSLHSLRPGSQGRMMAMGPPCWDDADFPDWLLLEVEQNITIRPEQVVTAREMMKAKETPSLYQLQMGKGKSSVILPMISAVLSSGSKLFRSLVLGPLVPSMFEILRDRLAHAMQRPIFYLPICRTARMSSQTIEVYQSLLEECVQKQGILLIEPEHVQSLELMEWDLHLFGDPTAANALRKLRTWIDTTSTDVMDESDEILRPDRELVYTEGVQRPIDFGATRGKIVLKVLTAALSKAESLIETFPEGFKISKNFNELHSLPQVRILQQQAEKALFDEIFKTVYNEGVEDYKPQNVIQWQKSDRVMKLVRGEIPLDDEISQNLLQVDKNWENFLLLLKGLLGDGVLSFCLREHHWRVTFGLDPGRSKLAVPFRGKDTPSPRTDFSHPDVSLILTALSYYYAGLSDGQLRFLLEYIKKNAGGASEYSSWVRYTSMPAPQRTLDGVNLLDSRLCEDVIFPRLRFHPETIQAYLVNIVFPSEMREFPRKSMTSGWNLVRPKPGGITGFSGTNDSKDRLPVPAEQCSLPGQEHTNAWTMAKVLQSENDIIHINQECLDSKASIHDFLEAVPQNVQVLIDVGAQLIDITNEEIAALLLTRQPGRKAAIFFDVDNVQMVITRGGRKKALSQTPFKSDLGDCLVILDEPHSRGTDLKLPMDSRALVILGLDMKLDNLLQACMRMRQLAMGQSLCFYVPKEVSNDVRDLFSLRQDEELQPMHLVAWAAKKSVARMQKLTGLWVNQGLSFLRLELARTLSFDSINTVEGLVMQREGLTISDRYGKVVRNDPVQEFLRGLNGIQAPEYFKAYLEKITTKLEAMKTFPSQQGSFAEQQQRELAPENEQEEEVQRGSVPKFHWPSAHPDLIHLVMHGQWPSNSKGLNGSPSEAITRAINMFRGTSMFDGIEWDAWAQGNLWVSEDFIRVLEDINTEQDLFMQPIEFILGLKDPKSWMRIIISSYEFNELAPLLRSKGGSNATVSCYSPQLTAKTDRLAENDLYSIPRGRKMQMDPTDMRKLSLFAGALYFKGTPEHEQMCQWLGIAYSQPKTGIEVETDGFIKPEQRAEYDPSMAEDCPFKKNPIPFLRWLLRSRRGSHAYRNSDMGKMLNGDYSVSIDLTDDDVMDLD